VRAISVRQPWAWQIIHQRKNIENRSRNIAGKYRGPVAIHASLKADDDALRRLPGHAPEWVTASRVFHYGAILGVVDLVDVHHCFNAETNFEGCSPWAEPDAWHLVLLNPRPLLVPIPCRGALGLWTPPADVLDQLQEARY
jgi:hypothetical protein